MDDELITVGQAAEEFGINRRKFHAWAREGEIVLHRSARDGRVRLVRRSDVARLLAPEPVRFPVEPERIEPGKGKAVA